MVTKKSFLDRVLDATPKWAMGIMGTVVGASICFIAVMNLADLKAPFNKYVEAEVARITKAVDTLEVVTSKLVMISAQVSSLEARVSELEKHTAAVDAKYHK